MVRRILGASLRRTVASREGEPMSYRRVALVSSSLALVAASLGALGVDGAANADPGGGQSGLHACSPGARTLSQPGDHVYPDMGNGGYTSLHTDVHMVYDAPTAQFLAGNHVVLTARSTQCLSELSLDFERSSVLGSDGPAEPVPAE